MMVGMLDPHVQRIKNLSAEVDVLEAAARHVLRYGKVGKQSEARLRAALRAVEVSRG